MEGIGDYLKIAQLIFEKAGKIIGMMVFVPKTKTIINPTFKDEEEKKEFSIFLREYCKEHGVDEFVISTEAWMITGTANEIVKMISPSKSPDRKEILMVTVVSEKENSGAWAEIIKKDDKRELKGWMYDNKMEVKTRWDSCLQY